LKQKICAKIKSRIFFDPIPIKLSNYSIGNNLENCLKKKINLINKKKNIKKYFMIIIKIKLEDNVNE